MKPCSTEELGKAGELWYGQDRASKGDATPECETGEDVAGVVGADIHAGEGHHNVDKTTDFSFPSDHATAAGAVAVGLLLTNRRWGIIARGIDRHEELVHEFGLDRPDVTEADGRWMVRVCALGSIERAESNRPTRP